MAQPSKSELKIKIIEFLEIAYNQDSEFTAKIIKGRGKFSLSIDSNGKALLSGKGGHLSYSVSQETERFGIDFKYASISFSGNNDGKLQYKATFGIGIIIISYASILDVEKLILSCSGLLCKAAILFKQRFKQIDLSIERAEAGEY